MLVFSKLRYSFTPKRSIIVAAATKQLLHDLSNILSQFLSKGLQQGVGFRVWDYENLGGAGCGLRIQGLAV